MYLKLYKYGQWIGSEVGLVRAWTSYSVRGARYAAAFSLVELLVVISIISALMAISIPAYNGIRAKAYAIRGTNNQRNMLLALSEFSNDHQDRYPPTFAYLDGAPHKDAVYYDPRSIVQIFERTKVTNRRSLSSFLYEYLPDSDVLQCPSAPDRCKVLPDVWSQGENWMPKGIKKQYRGMYCFYWDYQGVLDIEGDGVFDRAFRGPKGPGHSNRYSKLLLSDSFIYGDSESLQNNERPNFISCEGFLGAFDASFKEATNTIRSPRWWSEKVDRSKILEECPDVDLRAGFEDGHVEIYNAREAIRLRSEKATSMGPGDIFIHKAAVPAKR